MPLPAPNDSSAERLRSRLRVWDLPTRVFHALLACTVVAAIVTARIGGNAMPWHLRLGEAACALLLFRLAWGVCGGHWSRFGAFAYGPGAFARYLRGRPLPTDRFDVGHSPLAALSVWALLGLLAVQVATGLVADDEIDTTGPLNRFVHGGTAARATGWHHHLGQWLVTGLLLLHVGAVLWHRFVRGRDLIAPMWHGDKPREPAWPEALPASRDRWPQRLLALALFAACTLAVFGGLAGLGNP